MSILKKLITAFACIALLLSYFSAPVLPFFGIQIAQAATVQELQAQIDAHNATIKQLEADIASYQQQVDTTDKQAQTLKSQVNALDLTQKKLSANISVTQNKIYATNLSIQEFSLQIAQKEADIDKNLQSLAKSIVELDHSDAFSLLETILTYKDPAEMWSEVGQLAQFRTGVNSHMNDLRIMEADLQDKKDALTGEKKQLVSLSNDLSDQKKVVVINQQQKADLLTQTKNQESTYKSILAQKVALRDAFQQELSNYESQLSFAFDPSKLPHTGSGVLTWPLDKVTITQYFGNTQFAQSTGSYNGQGHNGIDLRASIGTPVKSAADGVVVGTGNTNLVCRGASYGQWILIKHNNGLSTLYGHLSLIKVNAGDSVSVGQIIGFSGQTGYATGPHLHFTVLATDASRIVQYPSKVCKGVYTLPVADLRAYLNPLLYL